MWSRVDSLLNLNSVSGFCLTHTCICVTHYHLLGRSSRLLQPSTLQTYFDMFSNYSVWVYKDADGFQSVCLVRLPF